jgi:hypothetical protein
MTKLDTVTRVTTVKRQEQLIRRARAAVERQNEEAARRQSERSGGRVTIHSQGD